MKDYRIKFEYPYYSVQERMTVGWWIFKKDFWYQLDFFYSHYEAEEFYNILIKKL